MTADSVALAAERRTDRLTVCQNCGSYVTDTFRRVFGNNQNELHGCLNCSTMRALRNGAGVRSE